MNYTKGKWEAVGKSVRDEEHIEICTCSIHQKSPNANAHLIAAAVNGCISVNPDNPQAVGEAVKDMYEALLSALGAIATLDSGKGWVKEITGVITKALAKAEGSADGN